MSREISSGYIRVSEILSTVTNFKWVMSGVQNLSLQIASMDQEQTYSVSSFRNLLDNALGAYNMFNQKTEVGSSVHAAIKAHQECILMPLSDREKGYFDSYLKWNESVQCTLPFSELRLYCDKLKITGCVDGLALFPHEQEYVVVDFKTSAQQNPKMWALQGAFYQYLAKVNNYKVASRCLFVKLDKDGKSPAVYSYEYTNEIFNMCMHLHSVYRYMNQKA